LLESEERKHTNSCDFTLTYLASSEWIAHIELESKKLSYEDTMSLTTKAIEGARLIYDFMRDELIN